jgi:hypothetical protein
MKSTKSPALRHDDDRFYFALRIWAEQNDPDGGREWLVFSGTVVAKARANLFSLVETCKASCIESL